VGAGLVGRLVVKKLGGFTGDVLGAVEQVAEILVLVLAAGAASGGWDPWWLPG
jgi:adenosylcobinamide-GDP ribazoletransferase